MSEFKQKEANINKNKRERPKAVKNTKPSGFKDMEKMAKDLLNAKGVNYFEWLHELHQKIILEEVARKKDSVVDLFL